MLEAVTGKSVMPLAGYSYDSRSTSYRVHNNNAPSSILNPLFWKLHQYVVPPGWTSGVSFESAPWRSSVLRPHRPTLDDPKGYMPWLPDPRSDHGLHCRNDGASRKGVVAVIPMVDSLDSMVRVQGTEQSQID